MPHGQGMLNQKELHDLAAAGEIDTVLAVITDLYGRFVGKRFDVQYFLDVVASHGSHACDYLFTVDMEMDPVSGYRFANWQRGYGDVHLRPDFSTLRRADWLDRTALVICNSYDGKTHRLVAIAPRSILIGQIERLSAMGLAACAGSELEYYLFRESYRDAHAREYRGLEPAGWYIEDYHALQGTREEPFHGAVRRHLSRSGVPVECTKGEWGKGQHELNVRYADVLEMADRHAVYKQCLKEVADGMQCSVTFMAKFAEDRAGCSCHVHLSLWHGPSGEVNAFAGDEAVGPVRCSEVFRWFLGGWIAHAREVMVLYAPSINSYKRFQPGSWAPTRLAWSYDNRTAGFRVVGSGSSLRIECRIPGADCNPYLVYAAVLACGIDGIKNHIDPPPCFEGDMYVATDLPEVPRTLRDATDAFEQSDFARQAFGDDVVEHYVRFFRAEQQAYDKAVTDWERRRYYERI